MITVLLSKITCVTVFYLEAELSVSMTGLHEIKGSDLLSGCEQSYDIYNEYLRKNYDFFLYTTRVHALHN